MSQYQSFRPVSKLTSWAATLTGLAAVSARTRPVAVAVASGKSSTVGIQRTGLVFQIGFWPVWVTNRARPGAAAGDGASTTASCSPTPDEYQGRSSQTRRVWPVRDCCLRLAATWAQPDQPNAGITYWTAGKAGRAELGRSTSSDRSAGSARSALARVIGGARYRMTTLAPDGMGDGAVRATVPGS